MKLAALAVMALALSTLHGCGEEQAVEEGLETATDGVGGAVGSGEGGSDVDAVVDGGGASEGGGGHAAYPVFPGTERRFMPGLVYHRLVHSAEDLVSSASRLAPYQDGWLNPAENTGLFISAQLRWPQFYADHSRRPDDPTNPSDPAYDWSRLDAMLDSEPIESGAIDGIWLRIYVRDGTNGLYPQWTLDEETAWICPVNNKEHGRWWLEDWRLLHDLQDFLAAFATRYKDDVRLAGIQFPENIWSEEACRDAGGFNRSGRNEATARRAIFLAEQMPNTSILTGGSFLDMDPWEIVDNEIGGFMPDVRLFTGTCGLGGIWPQVTCGGWNYLWMQDNYGKVPMGTASEPNGWSFSSWDGTTFAEANPFGFAPGDKPSLDGVQGAEIFTWYVSGSPRGGVTDSGLDDMDRVDPPGVLVSNLIYFGDMTWPEEFDLPQVADWDVAFRTFCWGDGEGTNACPTIPEGYRLER